MASKRISPLARVSTALIAALLASELPAVLIAQPTSVVTGEPGEIIAIDTRLRSSVTPSSTGDALYHLWVTTGPGKFAPLARVFDVALSGGDLGRSFTVDGGSDFENAVRYLTDGQRLALTWLQGPRLQSGGGLGGTSVGENIFGPVALPGNFAFDLAGYDITGFRLDITDLLIDYDGRTFAMESETRWTVLGRLAQTGAAPEPGTALLIGLSLAGLALGRRGRRGQTDAAPTHSRRAGLRF